MTMPPNLRAALFATASVLILTTPAHAAEIGKVALAEPSLTGTPPGGAATALATGSAIVADEVISSGPDARGQLMFLDQSVLSVAPNTKITLDKFVFDPGTGGGAFGVQLTKGALRFIGGSLSDQTPAVVQTPTANIGIRGSTGLVIYTGWQTISIFLAGEQMCISNTAGRKVCTSRSGGVLGEAGYLGRVSPAFLAQVLATIDGAVRPASGADSDVGGVIDPYTADLGTVSTTGKAFDPTLFDDDFRFDDLFESLPEGDSGPIICEECCFNDCFGGE